MLKLKKYLIFYGIIIIFILLLSLIYLLSNIPYNIYYAFLLITYLFSFASLSFFLTKNKNKKGIIIGSEIGLISVFTLFICSLIFKCNLKLESIIYYILVLLSSIMGAILSKNTKDSK